MKNQRKAENQPPVELRELRQRVAELEAVVNGHKRTEEALMASESEAKRPAQENASMARIGQIIGSTLAIEEVYERFAEEVRKLIPFDGISACIFNLSNGTFTIPSFANVDAEGRRAGDVIPLAGTAAEKVLNSRSSLLIQSENWDEVMAQLPGLAPVYAAGYRSLLMIPLFSKDDVIGALNFLSLKSGTYQERDLRMAERVGTQIAGAIANAQLFAESKRAQEALRREENRYRDLGDLLPQTIFEADERGNLTFVNRSAFEHFGYTPEDFAKGWNVVQMIAPEERERATALFRKTLSGERGGRGAEITAIRKDHTTFPAIVFSNAIVQSGKSVGMRGFVVDITERKRMEETLRESEERFRKVFEEGPIGMVLTSRDLQFFRANPAFCQMLGYTVEQMSNRTFLEVTHPEHRGADKENVENMWQGKIPYYRTEKRYITKDGDIRWGSLSASLIRGRDGKPLYALAMVEDITQRKQAEGEKAYLLEQLLQAQKMEAIGTLAGGIAHDFNNILAAILGFAELANLDMQEDSRAKYNVQQSIQAAHRAKNLVQQILAFSRQGRQERKPLNIQPIIKEALKFLRASLPSTIEIRQNTEEDLGAIEADPTEVYQVLMNLCTNAAHAMDEKGGVLEVSLSQVDLPGEASASSPRIEPGPYLRLRVSDTGHGMPQEILKKIFDPYFTTKGVGKGTGLGLAVVHGIVKSYGGGITVSSEVGKGSTFDVYFMRIQDMGRPLEAEKPEPFPFGGPERVLFVDDEKAIAEIGEKMLTYLGYAVEVRTSSIEALELFRAQADRFDLVITDMTMPNMTGDKLAQEVLRIRPGIPIILCTGFSESLTEDKAKAIGVRELVMKPLAIRDLAQAVRRVLDYRKKKQR